MSNVINHFLEGSRIYLRAFTNADIPVWYNWFNDPVITKNMNKGAFPNTEGAQEEYFARLIKSGNDVQLAIVLKEQNLLIGIAGIHGIDWIHRRGEISIVVGEREYHGKGLAAEAIALIVNHAFTKLNINKLTAGMWSSNISSRKCFEKNGFSLEGTLKKQFFHENSYVDEYRMGLIKDDWESMNGR